MRRLSPNRDLFEASPGEKIIVTVEAVKTPFQATFSDLKSVARLRIIATCTAASVNPKWIADVSIGAPYWHDILQALAALRPDKAKA